MKTRIDHLRVKITSLAAEARIIRSFERRRRGESRASLREHRRGIVRSVARHALLALGFLRGLDYERLERKAVASPDFDEVRKLVDRFGVQWDQLDGNEGHAAFEVRKAEQASRWKAWRAAADALFDHGNMAVVAVAMLTLAALALI